MSKELVKKEETAIVVGTPTESMSDYGIEMKDITIYKLLLTQKTSSRANEEKAEWGDIVHQRTNDKLASFGNPVEIIPLRTFKDWAVYDASGNEAKWVRTEPYTGVDLDWTFTEEGKPMRRDITINLVCLLADEANDGDAMPFIVSMKRRSFPAGKDAATLMARQLMFGQPVFAKTLLLSSDKEKQKNGSNIYAVFKIAAGNKTTESGKHIAKIWIENLKRTKLSVDNSDQEVETEAATPPPIPTMPSVEGNEDLY